ncbi:PTS sugar transporter subunit IIA [Paenibacillus lentus]|uniref:PTS sugar transporter subunit IIA n=1 Tax=Paenibacillus lentus TaxID=1338368 RepID=UPI00365C0515
MNSKPWIIIITHGTFGEELKRSAELIIGEMEDVYCFSLLAGMESKALIEHIGAQLTDAPRDSIFLTDLYGGTPSNIGAYFAKKDGYSVICGVNLPMLIEAQTRRSLGEWEGIEDKIIEFGAEGIRNITKIIKERKGSAC